MPTLASGGVTQPLTPGTTTEIHARWLGGGAAANCTRVTGSGITSVNYNAATGCYLITLTGRYTSLECGSFHVLAATGAAAQFVVHPISYSAANGTLSIIVNDVAVPAAHDLALTEEIWINLYLRDAGVYA